MKGYPSSLYRLQLTKEFTLKEATKLLPYLHALGVEGVYCSPYFLAHSPHGYDIVDPNRLNPDLATAKEYEAFCNKLHALGMFHLADIVPNHMGIVGGNRWWEDVLEKGRDSPYAKFFDVDWRQDKILIPLLGEDEKEVEAEHYKLVSWKRASEEIGYRRFFNINELIGIRIEDPEVLKEHHRWIFELLKQGRVDGLRIDHPDGLYDPKGYFDALRKQFTGLVVVEKILGWDEELPDNWKVEGTVGYEFLNRLTGVFVQKSDELTQVYRRFIQDRPDFAKLLYENKKFYMETEMRADVRSLASRFLSFTVKMAPYETFTLEDLEEALFELLASFPVYRTYIPPKGEMSPRDGYDLKGAFDRAHRSNKRVFHFLEEVFFLKLDTPYLRDCILRFQQLSAPIMAKGFEDITLYNYNRLLALNEVGSEPTRGGVTVEEFHRFCKRKQERWPLGILTSSTHDTKRSMDARMQLATLAEMPEAWEEALKEWQQKNAPFKEKCFPDPNMEYFLYQMLLALWPSSPSFSRLWPLLQKSLREARTYTSWREPNQEYEGACKHFLKEILKPKHPFLASFRSFQKKIQERGEWKVLAATALKLGAPGIVDVYEGCEHWRYSWVDPDNRTPVDYTQAQTLKYEVHKRALTFRREHKELFLEGEYLPLEVGNRAIIAYLRKWKKQSLLVAAVRFHDEIEALQKAVIELPKSLGKGVELFTGRIFEQKNLCARSLFQEAPYTWVFWEGEGQRSGR
jgi:(1->4)-alpha-D-glucan 1-alpha-D-glucosylmutase